MIDITFAEGLTISLSKKKLHQILSEITQALNVSNSDVALYITNNQEIAVLNQEYRQINKPTDILSWSYFEQDPQYLGELALSWEQSKKQARQNGWRIETEVIRLLAHGCVHLLGYDHQTEEEEATMLALEKNVLLHFGLTNIYPDS